MTATAAIAAIAAITNDRAGRVRATDIRIGKIHKAASSLGDCGAVTNGGQQWTWIVKISAE